jgi:hypothetical protein
MKFVLMFVIGLSMSAIATASTPSPELAKAQIEVESNGNDQAIGDTHLAQKAYGCLQIRQPVCDDVNHRYGTNYQASDCLGNRELSMKIYQDYIGIYATAKRLGHEPANEDMARIWNGGPNGYRRSSTLGYWEKVRSALGN